MDNGSLVVRVSGSLGTTAEFEDLIAAIDRSGLEVDGGGDVGDGLAKAIRSSAPLVLTAEEIDHRRISDFERTVHRMGLDFLSTMTLPGETRLTAWAAGGTRPREFGLDREGRVLLDTETVRSLAIGGTGILLSYLEEIADMRDMGFAALRAAPDAIIDFAASQVLEPMAPGP